MTEEEFNRELGVQGIPAEEQDAIMLELQVTGNANLALNSSNYACDHNITGNHYSIQQEDTYDELEQEYYEEEDEDLLDFDEC